MSGKGVRVPFSWQGSAFHTYLSVTEGPMHQLLMVKNLLLLFLVKVPLSRYTGAIRSCINYSTFSKLNMQLSQREVPKVIGADGGALRSMVSIELMLIFG